MPKFEQREPEERMPPAERRAAPRLAVTHEKNPEKVTVEPENPKSPPQEPKPATPDQPKSVPPKPQADEPKKVEKNDVQEPKGKPHETVPGRITHYEDPDDTPVIKDQPSHFPEAIEVEDDEVEKARATWAAEIERLSRQRVVSQPGQPKADDLPERKVAPPVKVVRPETLDQQTMQVDDASPFPGTGAPGSPKVQVVATDPSVIQVQRPAGEVAQGNATLDSILDVVPGLKDLIADQVKAALAAAGVSEAKAKASPVYQINPNLPQWRPGKYLKHYRNDVFPQKRYIRMHVDHDADKLVQDRIDLGEYIQFSNGHFFATDQRDVDQLEWMRTHPTHDRTGNTVIGGDPSIYIDDDSEDVLWCPECRKPFASATKMEAHRKATHSTSAVA